MLPELSDARPRGFAVRAAFPTFLVVVVYSIAMGCMEAAAVLYLRTLYGSVDPIALRLPPLQPTPNYDGVEVSREAATMLMLVTVGWLAGRGRTRIAAFFVAFGTWDIFYYVFLWLFSGWPGSLFAPDVLFLIPLPWWGPVIAPVLIAALMVIGGGLVMARSIGGDLGTPSGLPVIGLVAGGVLCLVAFMADALAALPQGLDAALSVQGGDFHWGLYGAGLFLMIGAVVRLTGTRRE